MRGKYYAVCYGNYCRWAGPCKSAADAVLDAFGIKLSNYPTLGYSAYQHNNVTVEQFYKNPKYMPLKDRTPFLQALYAKHLAKTGNEIK